VGSLADTRKDFLKKKKGTRGGGKVPYRGILLDSAAYLKPGKTRWQGLEYIGKKNTGGGRKKSKLTAAHRPRGKEGEEGHQKN